MINEEQFSFVNGFFSNFENLLANKEFEKIHLEKSSLIGIHVFPNFADILLQIEDRIYSFHFAYSENEDYFFQTSLDKFLEIESKVKNALSENKTLIARLAITDFDAQKTIIVRYKIPK